VKVKGIELATGCRIGSHSGDFSRGAMVGDSTGTVAPEESNLSIQNNIHQVDRNNFATVALLLAFCGLVLSFLLQWRSEMLEGIMGLAGFLCLLLMRVQLDNSNHQDLNLNAGSEGIPIITIEYANGYWLALVCFLFIAAVNIYNYMEQARNGKMEISDDLSGSGGG